MSIVKRKKIHFRRVTEEEKDNILNIVFNSIEEELYSRLREDDIKDLVIKVELLGEYFITIKTEVEVEVKSFRKIDVNKLLEEVLDKALERAEVEVRKILKPEVHSTR